MKKHKVRLKMHPERVYVLDDPDYLQMKSWGSILEEIEDAPAPTPEPEEAPVVEEEAVSEPEEPGKGDAVRRKRGSRKTSSDDESGDTEQ